MEELELQKIAKERTVRTQDIEYDLETIVKKIKKNVIKLDPEYQRNHVWNNETSSRLIESLILNIPVPVVYLSQDVDVDDENFNGIARYSVIDGQQRLTAINEFMNDRLRLTGMQVLEPLNGKIYSELPSFLIRRLEERTIKCLRIDSTLDSQVKYDIFERLNSGAVKLEAQELRNAIYRGPFNQLIKTLAKNEDFKILLQIDVNQPDTIQGKNKKVKKMEDVETVLRFFAFSKNRYLEMRKGLKEFLSESMKEFNGLNREELNAMQEYFEETMKLIREFFGDQAFAKYRFDEENNDYVLMSKFNISVFDALSVSVADEIVINKRELKENPKEEFQKLFKEETFSSYISGSTNDKSKIVGRINRVKEVL